MYRNLNDLEKLIKLKSEVREQNRANKLKSYEFDNEMKKLYKPVIEPLKSIADNQKIVTKAIEYNPTWIRKQMNNLKPPIYKYKMFIIIL